MAKAISITGNRLRDFQKTAKPRDELYDSQVKGFFFIQLAKGGAWRYRYTYNGKRYVRTVADADKTPEEARAIATEWRNKLNKGINPVEEIEQARRQAADRQQDDEQKRLVNTGNFFREIYTPHMVRKSHTGRDTLNIIAGNFGQLFDRDMDRLTPAEMQAWENKRKEKNTRATLERALSAFKAMINFAAGQKKKDPNYAPVIDDNPIKDFHLSVLRS
ncbi:MAG: integrase arm-type DNA-binding domain-containing protein [Thiohalomonadaceae bacterium]